ncbi:hypothetical protein KJ705_01865 [Patescibacteria group bacterium]|nr:hypothetical protein [Patescibacteria group bacterium]
MALPTIANKTNGNSDLLVNTLFNRKYKATDVNTVMIVKVPNGRIEKISWIAPIPKDHHNSGIISNRKASRAIKSKIMLIGAIPVVKGSIKLS